MSIQQDIATGVFCILVGIGIGYVISIAAPDIKEAWIGYSNKATYLPVKAVVEKISYIVTVDRSSDYEHPRVDYMARLKIRYLVGGKDFWVSCPLNHFQKTPNPNIENQSIDDLIKQTSAFSPGQPITALRSELSKSSALSLFSMNYGLGIKKIIDIKYNPIDPRLTDIDFSTYSIKSIAALASLVSIFTLIIFFAGYYKIRAYGLTAIIALYSFIVISMYGGLALGNKKMAERSHTGINLSTQDNPDPDEIVFHNGMTMPEFP